MAANGRRPTRSKLPFVFDNVAQSRSLIGDTPGAQGMADKMSAIWDRVSRAPEIRIYRVSPNGPAYEPSSRQTMCFDNADRVVANLEDSELKFFSPSPPRLPL